VIETSPAVVHVIPAPFRQASREYLHSQGMHVERHIEVIENTGEWRRMGGADFVKLRKPENMANSF
jgi:hypothetical protein